MLLAAPEPITLKPIQPPRYTRVPQFSKFLDLNYSALFARFLDLLPEERGDDYLDFCRTQWDLYGKPPL